MEKGRGKAICTDRADCSHLNTIKTGQHEGHSRGKDPKAGSKAMVRQLTFQVKQHYHKDN